MSPSPPGSSADRPPSLQSAARATSIPATPPLIPSSTQPLHVVEEYDNVIDGIHRLKAAAELGRTEVPTVIVTGLSLDEQRDLAITLSANRRHLAPAVRAALREQRIARVAVRRRQGESMRTIAGKEKSERGKDSA